LTSLVARTLTTALDVPVKVRYPGSEKDPTLQRISPEKFENKNNYFFSLVVGTDGHMYQRRVSSLKTAWRKSCALIGRITLKYRCVSALVRLYCAAGWNTRRLNTLMKIISIITYQTIPEKCIKLRITGLFYSVPKRFRELCGKKKSSSTWYGQRAPPRTPSDFSELSSDFGTDAWNLRHRTHEMGFGGTFSESSEQTDESRF